VYRIDRRRETLRTGVGLLSALGLVFLAGCARFPLPSFDRSAVARRLPPTPATGVVEGRVVTQRGADGADRPWVVVYLDGVEAKALRRGAKPAKLRSGREGFAQPVLAVAPGQPVELSSAGGLHHHFFSYSKPNDFDLGASASGQRRRLVFERAGVVRVYCSLHPEEGATIFVSPSPHFAALEGPGRYAIRNVPPGRYAVRTWSDSGTGPTRKVTVESGESAFVEIPLAGAGNKR